MDLVQESNHHTSMTHTQHRRLQVQWGADIHFESGVTCARYDTGHMIIGDPLYDPVWPL